VRPRLGIALVAALGLMTLLGLMIAGAFAASVSSERSSRLVHSDAQLSAAADYAINTVLGDPRRFGLVVLPLGQSQSYDIAIPGASNVQSTVVVTRLRSGILWLVADALLRGVDQARRRINVVARFPSVGPIPQAPIVARGNVVARDSVEFSADASNDADCATSGAPDIIVSPGSTISAGDSVHTSVRQSAADSVTYYLSARQLALLDSGVSVVHVRGDTTIAGGRFSGVLIADGSITIMGPFAVNGLLIARGSISAVAGGFSISGSMLAYGVGSGATSPIEVARASVRFSPCDITTVLRAALPAKPVAQRSWVEFF
jgi:hypothetical protein